MNRFHRFSARNAAVFFALAAIGLVLSFTGLAGLALLDPDESRYAETSREMIERGDYTVPHFNEEIRLKKPPLFHWAQIGSYAVFGVSEFSARLPSVLAYLGLFAATVAFARNRRGWSSGLRAGAILLTCPLAFVLGRAAIIDMMLSLFVCSALFCYHLVDAGRIGGGWGSAAVGGLLGLAFLAKGPVGILAPLVVIVAFHAFLREWRRFLRWKGVLIASLVVFALSLPWVIMVARRVGWESASAVWLRETVDRYSSGLEHPHGPLFFFIVMGLAAFPWSVFLFPSYVARTFRAWRGEDRLLTYLWVWIAAMIGFFSLGEGKLATYILPVMPAVAVFLARVWDEWTMPLSEGDAVWRRQGLEWAFSLALFIPAVVLVFLVALWDTVHAASFLGHSLSFSIFTATAVLGTLALSARPRRGLVVPLLTVLTSAFYIYTLSTGASELERKKSMKAMVIEARLGERTEARLCVYRNFHPSLVFYAHRRVERADSRDQLEEFLKEPGDAVVVMDVRRLASLGPRWNEVMRTISTLDDQVALEKRPEATPAMIDELRDQERSRSHGGSGRKGGGGDHAIEKPTTNLRSRSES